MLNKLLSLIMLIGASIPLNAQSPWDNLAKRPSTLGLESGFLDFDAGPFRVKLVKNSQTLASLKIKADTAFDFSPYMFLRKRSADGLYQLGDVNLRIRTQGGQWQKFSTAQQRMPVTSPGIKGNELAVADLTATFPDTVPVQVTRKWELDAGDLVLRFIITNTTRQSVEIGSAGFPMIFNNILDGASLDEAHARNVFYDPYIGNGAGYLQVTRLTGKGPALLVLPQGETRFEAYNPLLDDPTPRSTTFEGFYEWMTVSKAHVETDWKNAQPWNNAQSVTIAPGRSVTYAFKFVVAPSLREIEKTLVKYRRPVAVGFPGYVLPQNVTGKLFITPHTAIREMKVVPDHALEITKLPKLKDGTIVYELRPGTLGRVTINILYADGVTQAVHYKVIKAESKVVEDFGNFLFSRQWFDDPDDPFKRAPSVISYDYETGKQVTQDSRAWIAGLSDEGGAGSWLGAVMKQLVQPNPAEVSKIQQFVDQTIWGKLQSAADSTKYGVRKSLFYYEPKLMPQGTYREGINFKTWAAWPLKEANSFGRSYNYPHVAAAHWVMYRLARYHTGLVKDKEWSWYLENAYQTGLAMVKLAPEYAQFGQMEGSVYLYILNDLRTEGKLAEAALLEAAMKKRADHWRSLNYPFGSEMAWDSTGQEEVYLWSDYFGYSDKADITLNAILGYMAILPHWGYNGSARRYWDFLYGGKLQRVERQLHHYGSGLNAIPVLTAYRKDPKDMHLLRVGYGGLLGAIANITDDGFGPAAFHAFPSTLKIDGLSGDYGPNFYGYAVNSATYLVDDPTYGWLSFGGNLKQKPAGVEMEITTAAASKLFIGPSKLWLTLDAGRIEKVLLNTVTHELTVWLSKATTFTKTAYLSIRPEARYEIEGHKAQNGRWEIPLSAQPVVIKLKPVK